MSVNSSDSAQLSKIVSWVIVIGAFFCSSIILLKFGTKAFLSGVAFITIPLSLPAMIAIYRPGSFESIKFSSQGKYNLKFINHINFICIFLLLYLISIYFVFQNENRTLIYFLLVTLMGGIILLEILFFRIGFWTILLQEMALLINFILSYTLKHSSPIFTTDIFVHMYFIEISSEFGHLQNVMGTYASWPLFHIINTMGLILTNLQLSKSYFIINSLSFALTALFVYLIINIISKDNRLSLLAVLIYIFLRPVDYEGMNMITRSSAYVICIIILFLIIRKINSVRMTMLSVFLIIPLTLTHQSTLAFFSLILFIIYIAERLVSKSNYTTRYYLLLFLISILAYWFLICGPIFDQWLHVFFSTKESIYVAKSEVVESTLLDTILKMILKTWDFSVLLAISAVGAIIHLRKKPATYETSLALVSFILLPLIHPSVSDLFIAFLGYRWPILVSWLVAFIAANGFYFLLYKFDNKTPYANTVSILLVLSFFLASCTMTGYSTDFEDYQNFLGKTTRSYLLDSELKSFDFYLKSNEKSTVNSDYVSIGYLRSHTNKLSNSFSGLSYELNSPNTYLIFRDLEYRSSGVLDFSKEPISGLGLGTKSEIKFLKSDENPYPYISWANGLKIYNSNSVSIYFKEL